MMPPLPVLARQRVFPRSWTLLSQTRLDWATQSSAPLPKHRMSKAVMDARPVEELTVGTSTTGDTATRSVRRVTGILLQGCVGNAALAIGDWPATVLRHGGSGSEGTEAKENGDDGELHFCGGKLFF